MKYFLNFFLFVFLPVLSFAQSDSAAENKIRNIIQDLPEVKAMQNVFDSVSNRVQDVKMVITEPSGSIPFYKIEVGYQGSNRFEPHFYFYIDPHDGVILVEDTRRGDRPPLEEWRRRQKEGYSEEPDLLLMPDTNSTNETMPLEQEKTIEKVY